MNRTKFTKGTPLVFPTLVLVSDSLVSSDSSHYEYMYVTAFFDFNGSYKYGCKPPTATTKVSTSLSEDEDEEGVAIVKKI